MYNSTFLKRFNILKQQFKLLFNLKKYINHKLTLNVNLWNNLKKIFIMTFTKKYFKMVMLYIKYKQIIIFNKFKFSNRYILPLKNLLSKVYNKDVEFNLVTLNNFYFNSDILVQILTSKIRDRNRKRRYSALKVLRASIRNTKTPILNKKTIKREPVELIDTQNTRISDFIIKPNTIKVVIT